MVFSRVANFHLIAKFFIVTERFINLFSPQFVGPDDPCMVLM